MHEGTGPYAQAHQMYAGAGWRGVLPVGRAPAQKTPPPLGWTGHGAGDTWPSGADRQAWADGPEGARNIALRLPPDVIGLDVDDYGSKTGGATLAGLIERFGPLPPTWVTSARTDGVSGIRLYRLPPSGVGRHWPGEAGDNIEIVQTGHRYALVWPSVNPDAAGAVYRWRPQANDGRLTWADTAEHPLPRPEELPELPAAWVEGLALSYDRVQPAGLADDAVRAWLEACRRAEALDEVCPPVRRAGEEAARALLEGRARSRHELTRDAVRTVVAYGGEGHVGAWQVLGWLRDAWMSALEAERGRDAAGEWLRLLTGGVRLAAAANDPPRQACDCALRAGEGVSFEVPFGMAGAVEPLTTVPGEFGAGGEQERARDLADELLARMLTPEQMRKQPNPVPLINGLLDMDSLAYLIAAPGSFKSFVALDMAGHVGRGEAWQGRQVRAGEVVYLVAEGVAGMTLRVRAWEATYGDMSAVRFLPVPVQASNPQAWGALIEACRRVGPNLIILDTQARITVGMDENDATKMGEFIHAAEQLRAVTGACVLVVHHTGRAGGNARGSSAIDGAQASELKLTRAPGDMNVVMSLDKQKDAADDAKIHLVMERVDGGVDEETGRDLSSLVVKPAGPFAQPIVVPKPWLDELTDNQRKIVEVLAEHIGQQGGTKAEIRALIKDRFGDMRGSSFYTAFDKLVQQGKILPIEGRRANFGLTSVFESAVRTDVHGSDLR